MKFSVLNLVEDKTANTLAIFAAALVPLTIMVGSGVDMSLSYMAQTRMQSACDAGVLAARHSMVGTTWKTKDKEEAKKYFKFNFPDGTNGVDEVDFEVSQDANDMNTVLGKASGTVPTSVLGAFGIDSMDVDVTCNAKKDLGHNDIMMVLDVTGSMTRAPSGGGGKKISLLRTGTKGLYRALQDNEGGSRTRFGVVSYSQTVNVGGSLLDRDILDKQTYNHDEWKCQYQKVWWRGRYRWKKKCWWDDSPKTVPIVSSKWKNKSKFRNSNDACIEERPSVGKTRNPFEIRQFVARNDITQRSTSNNDNVLQFGRYDPSKQEGETSSVCPSKSFALRTFSSEKEFNTAINSATARVSGLTYHDVGLLWGARFLSSEGFFASDNPTEIDGVAVNKHLVFMTDGELVNREWTYSSHGIEAVQKRTTGGGDLEDKHQMRFMTACSSAKALGMTIWVIAFDVTNVEDIKDCATSSGHFYTSDGSDLEEVFEKIGQGIGKLRLTK